MGRSPGCRSCSKHEEGVNRVAWTPSQDKILSEYIKTNGVHRWKSLAKKAGLKRCGKSCRFRWLNYLRPDIKRGNISPEEDELIVRLHRLLGNRWAFIAGRLPGRTDNELKNYWNTQLSKRVQMGEFEPKFQISLKRKNVPSYSSYEEERLVEKENYSSETLPLKPTAVRYCGRAVVDAANLEKYNYDHVPDTHVVINQAANDHVVEINTSKSWCQLLLEDCMGDYQYDRLEAIDGLQYDIIRSPSNRTDYFHQPASPYSSRSIIIQDNHELQDFKDFNSSYIDSFLDSGMPSIDDSFLDLGMPSIDVGLDSAMRV